MIGHEGVYSDFIFNKGSVVVDPWRSFVQTPLNTEINIVYYGNTRIL